MLNNYFKHKQSGEYSLANSEADGISIHFCIFWDAQKLKIRDNEIPLLYNDNKHCTAR